MTPPPSYDEGTSPAGLGRNASADKTQPGHRGREPVAHARDTCEPGLRAVGVAVAVGIDAADRPAAVLGPQPGRAAAVARAQDAVEALGTLALPPQRNPQPVAG